MRCYIIIPCHNEARFIGRTLDSLIAQTIRPSKIVIVDDQSTDDSPKVIQSYTRKYDFITSIKTEAADSHEPGSKVIRAFHKGLAILDDSFDVICKFDADLIFPSNYLETIFTHFGVNPKVGMVGGFCYIQREDQWVLENLTNQDHIRGALKAYTKDCFRAIGGLKPAMGWDTVDELLAKYHNFTVLTDPSLHVKHLKPTGMAYSRKSNAKQGAAFYSLRYGLWLTAIASAKLALRKKKPLLFFNYLSGYFRAKQSNKEFLVTSNEGQFIRKLRWEGIKKKVKTTS